MTSKIKQPNKNWINDHNFNKNRTFKIMGKINIFSNKIFAKQMSLSVVNNPDSSSSLDTSCLVESSSPSHRLVESSSSSQLHRVILVESSSSSQPCLSESSSCSYGASSSHPRRVIESSPSPGEKIETSSSSVEVPLEISSVYLFIFERR